MLNYQKDQVVIYSGEIYRISDIWDNALDASLYILRKLSNDNWEAAFANELSLYIGDNKTQKHVLTKLED
jgi:hypothetical protein